MKSLEASRVRPAWFDRLVREAKRPPPAPREHPAEAELSAFAERRVSKAVAGAIGVHLYECGSCRRAVITLEAAQRVG